MAYIVDLTLIMQNIFWLVTIHRVPVSCRLVKFAYVTYKKSTVMPIVHTAIKVFVKEQAVLDRFNCDSAINKIEELLTKYSIDTPEMFRLKDDMKVVTFSGADDESWV